MFLCLQFLFWPYYFYYYYSLGLLKCYKTNWCSTAWFLHVFGFSLACERFYFLHTWFVMYLLVYLRPTVCSMLNLNWLLLMLHLSFSFLQLFHIANVGHRRREDEFPLLTFLLHHSKVVFCIRWPQCCFFSPLQFTYIYCLSIWCFEHQKLIFCHINIVKEIVWMT